MAFHETFLRIKNILQVIFCHKFVFQPMTVLIYDLFLFLAEIKKLIGYTQDRASDLKDMHADSINAISDYFDGAAVFNQTTTQLFALEEVSRLIGRQKPFYKSTKDDLVDLLRRYHQTVNYLVAHIAGSKIKIERELIYDFCLF